MQFQRDKHVIVFYTMITTQEIKSLITNKIYVEKSRRKEQRHYQIGDSLVDLETGEIFNVMARDVNSVLVLKPPYMNLSSDQKKKEELKTNTEKKAEKENAELNINNQYYSGFYCRNVCLTLMPYDGRGRNAKRYRINNTVQNLWIPNAYLEEDGTIKANANLEFIFEKWQTRHKIKLAYNLFEENRLLDLKTIENKDKYTCV